MDMKSAHAVLSALAQSTRLRIYRTLTRHPSGLIVGDIATALELPQNLLSSHLAILAAAGLVKGERHGRSVRYRARGDVVQDVAAFVTGMSED
jgi:ArsR family transcriptional regulator